MRLAPVSAHLKAGWSGVKDTPLKQEGGVLPSLWSPGYKKSRRRGLETGIHSGRSLLAPPHHCSVHAKPLDLLSVGCELTKSPASSSHWGHHGRRVKRLPMSLTGPSVAGHKGQTCALVTLLALRSVPAKETVGIVVIRFSSQGPKSLQSQACLK